ncbi:pyridoxamine 5'-phosphate oxidase family protein [Salinispira pacifica]|uniref:Pyridoxamine 5'-phosphate oxidase N-terminal domain-containing protein n=1 Tax=Salinispira pacifica TaxID=1307761 RepID=V5WIE1_9SPIO|nr:pyridoxamine 5'-phosphate oxidase family protein [Salinispira pacifica]AHC15543.1 hypothetical protein L21SP2_2180 [Salinispira pacifica]
MDDKQMMNILDRLLEEEKVAMLANVDEDGKPALRWMTPGLVRGQEGRIYAVTSPKFSKVAQLKKNRYVSWMIQKKDLSEILTIRGRVELLDNPSLRSMVMEAIGPKLATFWKLNDDETDVVILETVIKEIEYYVPATGTREQVAIAREESK